MRRAIRSFLALMTIGLLLGCTFPAPAVQTPVPAAGSLPVADVSTTPLGLLNATETGLPVETTATQPDTPNPVVQTAKPTLRNLFTITPSPTLDPTNVLLRIAAPGPMSKVVSPIDFAVYIAPEYTGLTRIQLLGEDGRELYSKAFRTFPNVGSPTRIVEQISFEIRGAAELGRLQVSTVDTFGRLQAFNSVRLLLLSVGENELTPPYPVLERVLLRTPKAGDEISGGSLKVDGQIQPINDTPVVLELYDSNGVAIGSRILTLQHADATYQDFSTVIPYKINDKTVARLMVHQADDRIPGLAYLYSVNIQVDP